MTETRGFYLLLARRAGARFWLGARVLYRPAGTEETTPATVRVVLVHISARVAGEPGQPPIDWGVSGGARVEYRLILDGGQHISASESEVLPDETDAPEAR